MERYQAVRVVKEIFDKCPHIEGRAIKLMPPDADSVLSRGFQVHIEANDSLQVLESCLTPIAVANGLAVKKEGDLLVVYNPL